MNSNTPSIPEVEKLKGLVVEKLLELGFTLGPNNQLLHTASSKDAIRRIHEPARTIELQKATLWLNAKLPHFKKFFANGHEIRPESIRPQLVPVTEEWQHELFRIARLYWSLPYSRGYGRRIRFLVLDQSNNKLIGIFALQSPPLSFPSRDQLFNYPNGLKTEFVNQTMDIQTLGAVPPYTRLLGGKLVAYAAASNEVRQEYQARYSDRVTEMEGRLIPAHLVALTTTSAFGKSSIYNRLKYYNTVIAESLGITKGYGSFHLMELYPDFRAFLEAQGISTRGGFGTGPRPKWQVIIRALDRLGLPRSILKHGISREAFIFPLINNLKAYLEGSSCEPEYRDLPFADLANYWKARWLMPRSTRVDGWHQWENEWFFAQLFVKVKDQPGNDDD